VSIIISSRAIAKRDRRAFSSFGSRVSQEFVRKGMTRRRTAAFERSSIPANEENRIVSDKDTGPESGIKGAVEGVKGKVKEAAGALAGKDELRREGQAQQEKADAQRDVAVKEAEAEKARAEAKAREAEQRSHQN
jgi:uncharacterized protein YjbJ (UPF0337 family)